MKKTSEIRKALTAAGFEDEVADLLIKARVQDGTCEDDEEVSKSLLVDGLDQAASELAASINKGTSFEPPPDAPAVLAADLQGHDGDGWYTRSQYQDFGTSPIVADIAQAVVKAMPRPVQGVDPALAKVLVEQTKVLKGIMETLQKGATAQREIKAQLESLQKGAGVYRETNAFRAADGYDVNTLEVVPAPGDSAGSGQVSGIDPDKMFNWIQGEIRKAGNDPNQMHRVYDLREAIPFLETQGADLAAIAKSIGYEA